jgi:hypothetical protein
MDIFKKLKGRIKTAPPNLMAMYVMVVVCITFGGLSLIFIGIGCKDLAGSSVTREIKQAIIKQPRAKRLFPERKYQEFVCNDLGGQTEVRMTDRTRVDCLTSDMAIEFDFADKWAEAVGQALHYARKTGKQGAIYLIIEKRSDMEYYHYIKDDIVHHGLDLRLMVTSPTIFEPNAKAWQTPMGLQEDKGHGNHNDSGL